MNLLLRAVNNALLDTYQLKSLDGIADGILVEELAVVKDGEKLRVLIVDKEGNDVTTDNYALREPYDRVISCLGYTYNFSLFSRFVSLKKALYVSFLENIFNAILLKYNSKLAKEFCSCEHLFLKFYHLGRISSIAEVCIFC